MHTMVTATHRIKWLFHCHRTSSFRVNVLRTVIRLNKNELRAVEKNRPHFYFKFTTKEPWKLLKCAYVVWPKCRSIHIKGHTNTHARPSHTHAIPLGSRTNAHCIQRVALLPSYFPLKYRMGYARDILNLKEKKQKKSKLHRMAEHFGHTLAGHWLRGPRDSLCMRYVYSCSQSFFRLFRIYGTKSWNPSNIHMVCGARASRMGMNRTETKRSRKRIEHTHAQSA